MISAPFSFLTPDLVQSVVEEVFALRLEGFITPFNSYINRVYGLKDEQGRSYAVKFYRPGRWNLDMIGDEHDFLEDCAHADIPVALPLLDRDGESIAELEVTSDEEEVVFPFALFPLQGGRNFDAEGDDDWLRLGRLLGRMHKIGAEFPAPYRPILHPELSGRKNLKTLVNSGCIHPEVLGEWTDLCGKTLSRIAPLFDEFPVQRLHGDCHRGNILDRPGQGLFLIDFDDMVTGPAVQDLWLLLPGEAQDCVRQRLLLTEGYNEFHPFDEASWELMEPLRFLRMVHYLAWQCRQKDDASFNRSFPDWGTKGFWIKELEDLRTQADRF